MFESDYYDTLNSENALAIIIAAVANYSHNHFYNLSDLNSARNNFLKLIGPKLV